MSTPFITSIYHRSTTCNSFLDRWILDPRSVVIALGTETGLWPELCPGVEARAVNPLVFTPG